MWSRKAAFTGEWQVLLCLKVGIKARDLCMMEWFIIDKPPQIKLSSYSAFSIIKCIPIVSRLMDVCLFLFNDIIDFILIIFQL